jgi:DNA invertase Pin-like site-specific DNA recombinase
MKNSAFAGVFKEAVLAILACIAKQERVRLSERVQAGLSRARGRNHRPSTNSTLRAEATN